MNKNKISLLLYKKADNTITKKELEKLNKCFEKNPELKEEYVLIENILKDLKSEPAAPLPENFSIKLREKLINYNLNTPEKKSFIPKKVIATSAMAVVLIGLMLNFKSIVPLTENKAKEEFTNQYSQRMIIPDADNVDAVNDNSKLRMDDNYPENNNSVTDTQDDHEAKGYQVFYVDCDISFFKGIPMEKIDENTYKVSNKYYENITELLKNISYKNALSKEDALLKEYFIIKTN